MAKVYNVYIKEISKTRVEIEAESITDATEKVIDGQGEYMETEYIETLPVETWKIEPKE